MLNILEKIYKSSLNLLEPLAPEDTYELIVKEAVKLVGADYGSLLVLNENGFSEVYSTLPLKLKRRKKGHTYKAFKDNKAYILHEETFGKTHPTLSKLGLRSNVYIPLSYKNKSIGVLIINSKKPKHFDSKELNVLHLYGSMASLGIRKTQLYSETRKALELRDQFIPLAAHELRTPLTSINGYIQLLFNRLGNSNSIEAKWIKELYFESKRLTKLVNELLEINKINSNQLNLVLKECNIHDLVEGSLQKFRQICPDRKIHIEDGFGSDKSKVVADKEKVEMIITHLLDNAAKFSSPEKEIDIYLKQKSKNINITIQDHGEGIDKQHLNKIFAGFYKGEYIHKSGMGLGLFLTKAIIEAHKGNINLQSKPKKGTKVTLKLPLIKT